MMATEILRRVDATREASLELLIEVATEPTQSRNDMIASMNAIVFGILMPVASQATTNVN